MANTKSALKRIRSSERKRVRNRLVRTTMRTQVKKARSLLTPKTVGSSPDALAEAISALDRAAAKGVIHKNAAARRKSRLMKLYNNLTAARQA